MKIFRFKTLCCREIKYDFRDVNDALMQREDLQG